MKLKALLRGMEIQVKGSKEIELTGLSTDSKTVAPGHLFIAKKGTSFDGAQFIPQALQSGAAAVVTDLYDPSCKAPQLIVQDPHEWEAKLAAKFYGFPSKELFVVGTTGSKGKTTTSYLIHHLLGEKAGLISTVETIVGQDRQASSLTTHFPIQNQKLLREMVSKGCNAVSFEVSSHGLAQNRVGEIEFDTVLFTNLFPDHLDYHGTIEEYAKAKRKLFELLDLSKKKKKRGLLNGDSPWAPFMREGISSPIWTFGIDSKCDIQASEIDYHPNGTSFVVSFQGARVPFEIELMGRFNVYNALGAIGVGLSKGMSLAQISKGLATFKTAPGRLEQVKNEKRIFVFVDYAHTGESLRNVLKTVRELSAGKLICVFGCGGNRDPGRRAGMGEAAAELADVSILTSDNPRNEEPLAIIDQIAKAFPPSIKPQIEPDRKVAIHKAIEMAKANDLVLIAGKGHEKKQILSNQTIPFDDALVAKEALQKS